MRLKRLSYAENVGRASEWILEELDIRQINLIVGKNASGKSRTMAVLNGLAQRLSSAEGVANGRINATFEHAGDDWHYELDVDQFKIVRENLSRGSVQLLSRAEGGAGHIWFEKLGLMEEFQVPPEKVAVLARQDSIQHPFLDPLVEWGKSTYFYPFGSELGKSFLFNASVEGNPKDFNQTIPMYRKGLTSLGTDFTNAVIADMREIGYNLTDIGFMTPTAIAISGLSADHQALYVHEAEHQAPVEQVIMSQGMFRALAILIQINFGIMSGGSQCVLIDDIGEGLDFDRSSALIHLLIAKVNTSNLQIIMTTNDRYVMNGVDLDYWTVLSRQGSHVRAFDSHNRASEFEYFKMTGLSNFDFLARDFLGG